MNTLVAAYNEGADEPLLIASEHSEGNDPAMTHGCTRDAITVAVDGDALLVQAQPATGLHGRERRIDCSRSDLGTAAYLLQDWMDQL
jgi:hypothetical protein